LWLHFLWILLLLFEKLTERTDEIDRRTKETDPGEAPVGRSPDERPGKGAKGPDTKADPGRCSDRKVLS
jgi:hypothetical protein